MTSVADLVARPAGRMAKPDAGGFIPPEGQAKENTLLLEVVPVV